ncbi:GyrI-like domain-containing protein [Actinosynnema sp.]|uniref:GyrI-like domain-containing protein n=1 Tax=Actinosynnema sp. TaxID=1872144 RepID=UPI003F87C161
MADKVGFKRTVPSCTAKRDEPELVEVPDLRYLAIDGSGDPDTDACADAVSALHPVACRLKFTSKGELGRDYVMPPPEGLWWSEDHAPFTSERDKAKWRRTLLLLLPDRVGDELLAGALDRVEAGGDPPARLREVRVEALSEGLCAQALHVGAYDDEAEPLRRVHEEFIPEHGLAPTGRHHEVCLSDPRRGAPAKRRTIVRQPVTRLP